MSKRSVFGGKAQGARLERIRASARFPEGVFRNTAPVEPGAQAGHGDLDDGRVLPRRRGAHAPGTAAHGATARGVGAAGGDGPARDVARPLDACCSRSTACACSPIPVWGERASPVALRGAEALPARAGARSRAAAARRGARLARPLRPPRLPDDPASCAQRDVPFVTSLGVGAHLEAWGVPAERITELDWWESRTLPGRRADASPRRRRSTSRAAGSATATRRCGRRSSCEAPQARVFFSGDTGLTPRVRGDPRAARAVRSGDARGRRVPPGVGRHPPRARRTRSRRYALLGGGRFLPVHWGTFNLALHAWDEPAETLLAARRRARRAAGDAAAGRGGGARAGARA